jgi:hypothetical protein
VGLREQAVSQENVEIVRRLVEAFYERDAETVASIVDAKIEFESALTLQTYKGLAGVGDGAATRSTRT